MDDTDPYRREPGAAAHAGADPAAGGDSREREPEGLGGWLIVVAAILGMAALMSALSLGFAAYGWFRGSVPDGIDAGVAIRIAGDAALLPLSLFALVLFRRRSRWFPSVFIGALALDLLVIAIRPLPQVLAGDISVAAALAIALLWALLWHGPWMLYTRRSRRVRNTFVARR